MGEVFQIRGPFDEKLRSPNMVRTHGWMYRSQFDTVEFMSIVKFFDCASTDLVCRICSLILSSYDYFGVFLSIWYFFIRPKSLAFCLMFVNLDF